MKPGTAATQSDIQVDLPAESPTGLTVVGLGIGGLSDLGPRASAILRAAEVVVGPPEALRQLAGLNDRALRLPYPSPFSATLELLRQEAGRRLVALASGDPLLFGIGEWLRREAPDLRVEFVANISSVQAAFAVVGKPWRRAQILSLHGRPLRRLRPWLRPHALLALLIDSDSRPPRVAAELTAAGYGHAEVWVCENLGTDRELVLPGVAHQLATADDADFSPRAVVILELGEAVGGSQGELIADEDFATDGERGRGMISKSDIRLAALARLHTGDATCAWDLGAGCGALTVDWARLCPQLCIHAVEKSEARLQLLRQNSEKFGVDDRVKAVLGEAPAVLKGLPRPQRIFVGGGGTALSKILAQGFNALAPGGRLVVSAVTLDAKAQLVSLWAKEEVEWSEIAVAVGDRLGPAAVLRPRLPVLLATRVKKS